MQISRRAEILFEWAKEISNNHSFWDFHVHPFCVLSGDVSYKPSRTYTDLFSTRESIYRAPQFDEWSESAAPKINFAKSDLRESALLLSSRLTYTFTGPRIFSDFYEVIGISNAMLLPLVRSSGNLSEMLEIMVQMYSSDKRFKFGCPVPVGLPPSKIDGFFQNAITRWNVQCIKLHPNLAGIDPISDEGQTIIYSVLESAGKRNLPIVVHGGRTPGITPIENREFSMLANLSEIDWSVSSAPVIFAHSGCYGLEMDEGRSVIGILEELLSNHSNLFMDTSALTLPFLELLMGRIDPKHFIFGSDALYFSTWSSWLTLLKVLNSISSSPEVDLIQIASVNPQNCLGL